MTAMKRFRNCWLILICILPSLCNSQNLVITNNNFLELSGTAYLVINNQSSTSTTSFNNNYAVKSIDASTILFKCISSVSMGGSPPGTVVNPHTYRNLTLNLDNGNLASPNKLTLNVNIIVNGDLGFASNGLLELNGKSISLGTNAGQIVGENNNARITGINGGTVTKIVKLSNPTYSSNFGNIGLQITTSSNNKDLGNVTVTRGHVQQQNSSGHGVSSVYRYFDIKPTSNPSGNNISIQFNYFDAEIVKAPVDFTNSKSDFTIWNSQDNTRQNWLLLGDDANDVNNNWEFKQGMSTLTTSSGVSYRVTLSSRVTNPLPVKLLYFTGYHQNNRSNLSWLVSGEGSTDHFELERSSNGKDFYNLSLVPAQINSNKEQQYSFTDSKPFSPVTYYRLKMVDKNQSSTYSNIVTLSSENQLSTVKVFPNPFNNIISLSFESDSQNAASIQLFNGAGQLVLVKNSTIQKGENKIQLNVESLPKGIYLIRSSDNRINNIPIIKN